MHAMATTLMTEAWVAEGTEICRELSGATAEPGLSPTWVSHGCYFIIHCLLPLRSAFMSAVPYLYASDKLATAASGLQEGEPFRRAPLVLSVQYIQGGKLP